MAVFVKRAILENAVVFLATHGGYGENGELQVRPPFPLDPFNPEPSRLDTLRTLIIP